MEKQEGAAARSGSIVAPFAWTACCSVPIVGCLTQYRDQRVTVPGLCAHDRLGPTSVIAATRQQRNLRGCRHRDRGYVTATIE